MVKDHVGYVFINGMILGTPEVRAALLEKDCAVGSSKNERKLKGADAS